MFRGSEALVEMAVPGPMKCSLILLFCSVIGCNGSARSSTSGRKFIVAFLQNLNSALLELHLVAYERPATVSVSVEVPHYNRSVVVGANSTSVVTLNSAFMLRLAEFSEKAITVTADEDISLYMFIVRRTLSASMLGVPVAELGTRYYVVTYDGDGSDTKQFAIASGDESAEVTVTVAGSLTFNGTEYSDRQRFSFAMEPKQAVQFQSYRDLTGTSVVSTTPVAVFTGGSCIWFSDGDCGYIAEQLCPVENWGDSFAIFPLLIKERSDLITILAAEDDTAVSISTGEGSRQLWLPRGSHINVTVSGGMTVDSSKPVLVTYLCTGGRNSKVFSFDPYMVNVIPSTFFSNDYTFVTMASYHSYIMVVSPGSTSDEIVLDGLPLATYPCEKTTFSQFTATRVYLGQTGGRHVISHYSTFFGIYVYGIQYRDAYGYSMGSKRVSSEQGGQASLACLPQAAVYTFPSSALASAGLSVADVHLIDPSCRADQKDENWVVITAPFDSCGTKIINETGEMGYVNTVYGTVPHTPIQRLEIELKCDLSTTQAVTMAFVPQADHVSRLGHYNVSFTLYRSAAFEDPVLESPYEPDLNGALYIEMEVETADSGVEIFTESCVSAPSLTSHRMSYSLIQNGCPNDPTFETYQSNDTRKQRFSFHVFKFEDYPEVYVTCEVVICYTGSSPNRCSQGCLPSRHKRSLSKDKSARLSQGPVVFPSDLEGSLHLRLSSARRESDYYLPLLGVLSGGCLISILALMLQRQYYLRQAQGSDTAGKQLNTIG